MAFKSTILFDVMDNILVSKSETKYAKHVADENFKDVSSFILVRYMGMSPDYRVREFALDRQESLERLPPKALYRVLMRSIPKQRSGFIRFLK